MNRMLIKIGLSPRFLHHVPRERGLKGKILLYLERSIAHWQMRAGATQNLARYGESVLVALLPGTRAGVR